MKIYIDSLILLNFIMNYFLVSLSAYFGAKTTRQKRIVFSSLLGAAFSFYIFAPIEALWLHIGIKLLSSVAMVLTAFGFGGIRRFIRLLGIFIGLTFLFGGFFLALAQLLPQQIQQIHNGVVYINFSPLVFLVSAGICYLVIYIFKAFFSRKLNEHCVMVELQIGNRSQRCPILLDTGHSLRDLFTDLPVLILSVSAPTPLLSETERKAIIEQDHETLLQAGYRLIPYKTVAASKLLPIRRADNATLYYEGKKLKFKSCIGFTGENLSDDFKGIISPNILNEV